MKALQVHVEGIRTSLILKRDKKIAGFLRRMNLLDHEITQNLAPLKMAESEICDPELDPERMDYALEAEMSAPVPEFRTAAVSLDAKQKRIQSAPKAQREY
jgi:hypothetical protein